MFNPDTAQNRFYIILIISSLFLAFIVFCFYPHYNLNLLTAFVDRTFYIIYITNIYFNWFVVRLWDFDCKTNSSTAYCRWRWRGIRIVSVAGLHSHRFVQVSKSIITTNDMQLSLIVCLCIAISYYRAAWNVSHMYYLYTDCLV